jgi:hypothetical protein
MSNEYNGWSNFATWKVNLELVDGMDITDMGIDIDVEDREMTTRELSEAFKEMAHETVEMDAQGWARDLAMSFLSDVNWYEIAEHMVDDYFAENV